MRWLCLLALTGGCAESTLELSPEIFGDWFTCTTADCTTLADNGLRFASDGFMFELNAPGITYESGERYCTWPSTKTYRWSEDQLTLADKTLRFEVAGDRATQKEGTVEINFQRVPDTSKGPCDASDGPQITTFTATPDTVSRGGTTVLTWAVQEAGSVDILSMPPERALVFAGAQSGTQTSLPMQFDTTYKLIARSRHATIESTLVVSVPDAFEKIVESPGRPYAITIDGDELFWLETGGKIMKSTLDGKNITQLSDHACAPHWLAVDGAEIFFAEPIATSQFRYNLWRTGKDGTGEEMLAAEQLLNFGSHLAVFGEYLYWSELDYAFDRAVIKRTRRDGTGGVESITSGLTVFDGRFGFANGRLIYRDSRDENLIQVYSAQPDGTNTTTVAEMGERGIGFKVAGGALYWTTARFNDSPFVSQSTRVHRVELQSGARTVLTETELPGVLNFDVPAFTVDETHVYLAFPAFSWAITAIPNTGGAAVTIGNASGSVPSITSTRDHVYWSDDQGDYGAIVRAPTSLR